MDPRRYRLVALALVAGVLTACSAAVPGTANPQTTSASAVRPVPGGDGAPSANGGTTGPAAPTVAGDPGTALPTGAGTTGPGARGTGGPPSWVRPGTRISYYEAAASVAQSRFEWVEDPSGTWVDPKTGTHYRRTDESGEGVATASGDGVSQYDVLAVSDSGAVVSDTLYGIDHGHDLFIPAGLSGAAVNGPVLDGVWINPDRLPSVAAAAAGTLQVLTGPYPLGGKTYQAISFASTDPDAYQSYTYDTATGLLLVATTRTAGATSPLAAPGQGAPQANTQLTTTVLAGVRQRTVPGLGGTDPDWAGRRLDYSGTYQWTNPVDPSSGSLSYPAQVGVTFSPAAAPWFGYTATSQIQMPGATAQKVSGVSGPSGLYWIDPAALTPLRAGQTLDSDPLTRETLQVTGSDDQSVTLTDSLPGVTTTATYSPTSGALLALRQQVAGSGSTLTVQLGSAP